MSTKRPVWPWYVLGLEEAVTESRVIRRAYAKQLKMLSEDDVSAFNALRQAYTYALSLSDKKPGRRRPNRIPDDVNARRELPVSSPDTPVTPPVDSELSPEQAAARERLRRDIVDSQRKEGARREERRDTARQEKQAVRPYIARPQKSPNAVWPLAADAQKHAKDQEMIAQAQKLIKLRIFSCREWKKLLAEHQMLSWDMASILEALLIQRLNTPFASPQSPNPPVSWIRLLDEHFGWHRDSVGFARRFRGMELAKERIIRACNRSTPVHRYRLNPKLPSLGILVALMVGLLLFGAITVDESALEAVARLFLFFLVTPILYSLWHLVSLPTISLVTRLIIVIIVAGGFVWADASMAAALGLVYALVIVPILYGVWRLMRVPVFFLFKRFYPPGEHLLTRWQKWWSGRFLKLTRQTNFFLLLVLVIGGVIASSLEDVPTRSKLPELTPEDGVVASA